MTRIILAVFVYVTSLVALLVTAGLVSRMLALYPPDHLASYGPAIPATATKFAAGAQISPLVLGVLAVLSVLAGLYFWRCRRPVETKTFAILFVAAVNLYITMFCTQMLVIAYFFLPKLANWA